MKHRSSRSKSKTKKYYQPQRKSSLASLMEHYNPDDTYSVKLNMNSHTPQIIQTKAYNFSSKANQQIKYNRSKSPKQNMYFNGVCKRLQLQNNSRYQSQFSSNRVTPTKIRNNNLLGREQSYFNSNRSSKETSRQGIGLFRQIIKKQSKQNSICHNSQYYDMIEKKAHQIKEQKKKILERCHSNGTLSNVLQTMKLNAHNEIQQYARSILGEKDLQRVQKGYQSSQFQTSQSKISQVVGNSNKQNSFIYNNQFSFQMDNFLQDKTVQNNLSCLKQSNDQYNIFNIKPIIYNKKQKQNSNQNVRLFSKISHSSQNNSKLIKNQKSSQINKNIITSNDFFKFQMPQQSFVNPKEAITYTHIQLKHFEPIKTTTAVEMNIVPKTDQWIKMKKPNNLSYLSQSIQKLTVSPKNQDFLKTNDFTYPFKYI